MIVNREPDDGSPEPAGDHHDDSEKTTVEDARGWRLFGRAILKRMLARPVLVTVVAALVGLAGVGSAAWMHLEAAALRTPTENIALLDPGATKQVRSEVSGAVERVYGYSYRSLDDAERAAKEVVTGAFAKQFREEFATVRNLAPRQKAVVNASVAATAVRSLTDDRAEVLVFLDQSVRNEVLSEPASTGSRLMVTAERVDGRWKISEVVNL